MLADVAVYAGARFVILAANDASGARCEMLAENPVIFLTRKVRDSAILRNAVSFTDLIEYQGAPRARLALGSLARREFPSDAWREPSAEYSAVGIRGGISAEKSQLGRADVNRLRVSPLDFSAKTCPYIRLAFYLPLPRASLFPFARDARERQVARLGGDVSRDRR